MGLRTLKNLVFLKGPGVQEVPWRLQLAKVMLSLRFWKDSELRCEKTNVFWGDDICIYPKSGAESKVLETF